MSGLSHGGLVFSEARCQDPADPIRVLVAYDTPSDRRRRRLAKLIVGHVPRAQKSVYDGTLSPLELRLLRKAIVEVANPANDLLLIAPLCVRCARQVERIGTPAGKGASPAGTVTASWHELSRSNMVIA